MSPLVLNAVRYGIPAALVIAGVVVSATGGLAAGALFISAGTAVLLLNVLHRMGVEGDRDRDRGGRRTPLFRRARPLAGRAPALSVGPRVRWRAYSPSCLPRISFITSSVPPPIGPSRVSRTTRSISYSRM